MKKIVALLLSLNMLLVADTMLDGNPMDEVVPVIKEKLGIPKKLNENISLTDLYSLQGKYIVFQYTYNENASIDSSNVAITKLRNQIVNFYCYEEKDARDILGGDNKKNIIKKVYMHKGKEVYHTLISEKDCK